jgi:hypothetical protein
MKKKLVMVLTIFASAKLHLNVKCHVDLWKVVKQKKDIKNLSKLNDFD